MDLSVSQGPGQKAEVASSWTKRVVLATCALAVTYFYISHENRPGAANPPGDALQRNLQDMLGQVAVNFDDPITSNVRNLFYDQPDAVFCGEVNGRRRSGQAKDGVRVFVCGPGTNERQLR